MKNVTKITIECDDDSSRVFIGEDAANLTSAIVKMYESYIKNQIEISNALENLLRIMRKV